MNKKKPVVSSASGGAQAFRPIPRKGSKESVDSKTRTESSASAFAGEGAVAGETLIKVSGSGVVSQVQVASPTTGHRATASGGHQIGGADFLKKQNDQSTNSWGMQALPENR